MITSDIIYFVESVPYLKKISRKGLSGSLNSTEMCQVEDIDADQLKRYASKLFDMNGSISIDACLIAISACINNSAISLKSVSYRMMCA